MGTSPTEKKDTGEGDVDPPKPPKEPPDKEPEIPHSPHSPHTPIQTPAPPSPKKMSETGTTLKVAKTELLPPDFDENLHPLASPVSGDVEVPIHLQYARFPKPIWPKSPITIPSSFFRDVQHQRVIT